MRVRGYQLIMSNHTAQYYQGEGPPVCYAVKYMDCTVHGIGASKFPLLQQENLNIELLRAALHISKDYKIFILVTKYI